MLFRSGDAGAHVFGVGLEHRVERLACFPELSPTGAAAKGAHLKPEELEVELTEEEARRLVRGARVPPRALGVDRCPGVASGRGWAWRQPRRAPWTPCRCSSRGATGATPLSPRDASRRSSRGCVELFDFIDFLDF